MSSDLIRFQQAEPGVSDDDAQDNDVADNGDGGCHAGPVKHEVAQARKVCLDPQVGRVQLQPPSLQFHPKIGHRIILQSDSVNQST